MDKINAALIFFTRLPVWRYANPSQAAYRDVVVFWPYIGWITGALVALVISGMSIIVAMPVAVVLALICRIMITGALHEDGFADFCDGFGCGGDKIRILEIMKDSHIGTYGVIGLIVYYLLVVSVLSSLPPFVAAMGFLAGDAFCKFLAAQITNLLPYSRPEGAKNGISYSRMSVGKWIICFIGGLLPLGIVSQFLGYEILYTLFFPTLVMFWMVGSMRRKIDGYTGDCCGATFLLCEVSFLLSLSIIF